MKMQAKPKAISTAASERFQIAAQALPWNEGDREIGYQETAAIESVLLPALSPCRCPEVKRKKAWESIEAFELSEAAALYERATGESPHEVVAAGRAVLIETGVAGSYADFPNGYVPILISPTSEGYVVFDTGQTVPKQGTGSRAVMRDGDMLYVKTDKGPEALQRGIRTMVGALRQLNEGL